MEQAIYMEWGYPRGACIGNETESPEEKEQREERGQMETVRDKTSEHWCQCRGVLRPQKAGWVKQQGKILASLLWDTQIKRHVQ
jgi:hypothetical protein